MYIRSSLLMQSLLINIWPQQPANPQPKTRDNINFWSQLPENLQPKAGDYINSNDVNDDPFLWQSEEPTTLTPIPDHKDAALMSRFIVHNANWTSIAYTSHQEGTAGRALADMFAVSDGPVESGSGVPYFFVTRLEYAVTDLLDNSNELSLMMSLAMTPICNQRGWDPEDPRCAHVVLTGTFNKVDVKSDEYPIAEKAVFTRHPYFTTLPNNHDFFVAKFTITGVQVQDYFGGPIDVSVDDYFAANSRKLGLVAKYPHNFGVSFG